MGTYKDVGDSVPPRLLSYRKEDESQKVLRQDILSIYLPSLYSTATLFNLDTIDSKGHTTSVQLSSETHRSHRMRMRKEEGGRGRGEGREEEGFRDFRGPFRGSANLKIIHLISTHCFRPREKH